MKKILALALLAGGVALTTPVMLSSAQAAPAAPLGVATPDTGVQDVAMRRKRMMKRRGMSTRRARMMDSNNAKNPSRPVMQQNQGMTSGGPRY